VIGYCGTCRVHFTTLEEWVGHQHSQRGIGCSCGRSFTTRNHFRQHVDARYPEVHIIRSVA
jgi:hypothetical protein